MKTNLIATGILFLAIAGFGNAQETASAGGSVTHYTKAQLKQMVREAHSPKQFNVLASYYDEQQKHYLQQAAEERQEWVQRSENVMAVAAKYPRPADSARYQYEYDLTKASKAGGLAAKYSQIATQDFAGEAR
jgi:uncharacterized protein YgbK (DUF1537 family)